MTKYLVLKHSARKPRSKTKKSDRTLIPNRVDIDKRPLEVNERKEFGHFQADTIFSKQTLSALLVIVDRLVRKVKIKKLTRKPAEEASSFIVFAIKKYNIIDLKTITYDNPSEFYWHERVNKKLNIQSFFCYFYFS